MSLRLSRNNLVYSVLVLFVFLSTSCSVKKKAVLGVNGNRKTLGENASLSTYYSDLLGVSPKNLNIKLYEAIDKWMNVPHKLGGMSDSGVDCSGFVSIIYDEVYNKNLPRMSKNMASIIKRKYENQLKEGDLVFFSFGGREIDHVGIYLHNGKFVHVSTKSGVTISNIKDSWYYRYFKRCGSPK